MSPAAAKRAGITTAATTSSGVVDLVRFRTTIGAPALTVTGMYVAGADIGPIPAVASFLMMCFAQSWNDLRDRETDATSKPDRPLPAGTVTVRAAVLVAAASAIGAIIVVPFLENVGMLVVITSLALAYMYSVGVKSTVLLGNAVVAWVSASTVLVGLSSHQVNGRAWSATAIVFLFILGNEILKSAEDADGDRLNGITTLATRYPLATSGRCVAISALLLATTQVLAAATGTAPVLFTVVAALTITPFTTWSAILASSRTLDGARLQLVHRWWRIAWTPGLLALPLLGVTF